MFANPFRDEELASWLEKVRLELAEAEDVIDGLAGYRYRICVETWSSARQVIVDDAGLAQYRWHHCEYCVGIGFPPRLTGGNMVTGLRHDSGLEVCEGVSFHIVSWLMGTGKDDFSCRTAFFWDRRVRRRS